MKWFWWKDDDIKKCLINVDVFYILNIVCIRGYVWLKNIVVKNLNICEFKYKIYLYFNFLNWRKWRIFVNGNEK